MAPDFSRTSWALRWRYEGLTNKESPLPFDERLVYILGPFTRFFDFREIVRRRIQKDQSGDEYLTIGKWRIYFDLDLEHANHDHFLKGIGELIGESFVRSEYFTEECRPKKNNIVFDLGANIGTVTLLLSEYVGKGGKVYAFEPLTFRTLEKNVESNDLSNCEVIERGVSDRKGEANIRISSFAADSTIVERVSPSGYWEESKRIQLVALDDFCEERHIQRVDFIKMDIEGAEELAILGATKIIRRFHPVWSIASYHIDSRNRCEHQRLKELLKRHDYRIKEIPNYHIFAF